MTQLGLLWQILFVSLMFIQALVLGQIAHCDGGGSIWAGWLVHALVNTLSSLLMKAILG